jgi:polar amino acid transport system substrate-binding protein
MRSVGPLGILVVVAAVGVAAWLTLARKPEAGGTLARARAEGVVRIGFANEAPYGYLDTDTGRVTGEAPEIARVILKRLGIDRVETVTAEFGSLIPMLKAGRFDVIAAGMYVLPERCREVLFSNPTYRIGEAFLVRAGNPLDLNGFADAAKHATARVGVMGGAVEHTYARAAGVPDDRIVVFDNYQTALVGLTSDRVDAVAATYLTAEDLLRKANDGTIARADPFEDPVVDGEPVAGYGAFAFRKGDEDFVDEFNRRLAAFLGTKEHLDLVRPFGFGPETLPGGKTAEALCGAG